MAFPPSQNPFKIAKEIREIIKASGLQPSEWRVGLTHNIQERFVKWGSPDRFRKWEAPNLKVAQRLESVFINRGGLEGGLVGI